MKYIRLEEDMEGNMFTQEYLLEEAPVKFVAGLLLNQKLVSSVFELQKLLNKIFNFKCFVQLLTENTYIISFKTEDGEQGMIEYIDSNSNSNNKNY